MEKDVFLQLEERVKEVKSGIEKARESRQGKYKARAKSRINENFKYHFGGSLTDKEIRKLYEWYVSDRGSVNRFFEICQELFEIKNELKEKTMEEIVRHFKEQKNNFSVPLQEESFYYYYENHVFMEKERVELITGVKGLPSETTIGEVEFLTKEGKKEIESLFFDMLTYSIRGANEFYGKRRNYLAEALECALKLWDRKEIKRERELYEKKAMVPLGVSEVRKKFLLEDENEKEVLFVLKKWIDDKNERKEIIENLFIRNSVHEFFEYYYLLNQEELMEYKEKVLRFLEERAKTVLKENAYNHHEMMDILTDKDRVEKTMCSPYFKKVAMKTGADE